MLEDILNYNLDLKNEGYPSNIYAIRIKDDCDNTFDIAVEHNGYCPEIDSDRDQSDYLEYLSNLECTVVSEYFKNLDLKEPKRYSSMIEVVTDSYGNLYRHSESVN